MALIASHSQDKLRDSKMMGSGAWEATDMSKEVITKASLEPGITGKERNRMNLIKIPARDQPGAYFASDGWHMIDGRKRADRKIDSYFIHNCLQPANV